jgi:hypothetical protein
MEEAAKSVLKDADKVVVWDEEGNVLYSNFSVRLRTRSTDGDRRAGLAMDPADGRRDGT